MAFLYILVAFGIFQALPLSSQFALNQYLSFPANGKTGASFVSGWPMSVGSSPIVLPASFNTHDPYTLLTAHLCFFAVLALMLQSLCCFCGLTARMLYSFFYRFFNRIPGVRSYLLNRYRSRVSSIRDSYLEYGFTQAELDTLPLKEGAASHVQTSG